MEAAQPPQLQTAAARFELTNLLGLHARAAAQLVNLANRFNSDITVRKGGEAANGKSIMGVLMLAAAVGSVLEIEACGPDCREAVESLGKLIADRFGEEE
jgi:phosphocarrier protein